MKVRITKKLLAEVPQEVKEMYLFYKKCVEEDYRRYGSPGIGVYALYKSSRSRVIEILKQKKLI